MFDETVDKIFSALQPDKQEKPVMQNFLAKEKQNNIFGNEMYGNI